MMLSDRAKEALVAFVKSVFPRIDYHTLYDAKLISQSGDLTTCDVQPDDPRIKVPSNIPLRTGVAGSTMKVDPGTYLRVGWANGDPTRPYAALWNQGASVQELNFKVASGTGKINLASDAHPLPLWDNFESDLTQLLTDISTQLALGTVGSPVKQQLVGSAVISAKIVAFNAKVNAAQYNSRIVSNG